MSARVRYVVGVRYPTRTDCRIAYDAVTADDMANDFAADTSNGHAYSVVIRSVPSRWSNGAALDNLQKRLWRIPTCLPKQS
jgi:hypothetical protein